MNSTSAEKSRTRRSLRGNVDRNAEEQPYYPEAPSRSLRGNVDRNSNIGEQPIFNRGRSLRGNVDRNIFLFDIITSKGCVVPYVGTLIEIRTCSAVWRREVRRSLRGNVDRNQLLANGSENGAYSRSLRGNVDRNDTEAEALEYLE